MEKLSNNEVFSPPLARRALYKDEIIWKWNGEVKVWRKMSSFSLDALILLSYAAWRLVFHSSSSFKDFWASQITNVRSASMSRWASVSDWVLSGIGRAKREKRQKSRWGAGCALSGLLSDFTFSRVPLLLSELASSLSDVAKRMSLT